MEKLLSLNEVSIILNVSYRNIIDLVHLGKLQAIKIGRQYRIHPKTVKLFIEKNKYKSSSPFGR